MSDELKIEGVDTEQKTRRSAIKTAAQVAVTAPAVAMLLSASAKPAKAQVSYDAGTVNQTGTEPSSDVGNNNDDAGLFDDPPPAS